MNERKGVRRPPRARTPTVLQFEAAECGAAALGMILGYHGRHVPLETLRNLCGVSRDGSKASNILKAARSYGLTAKGLKAEPEHLYDLQFPIIAFVDFCHFLVVEGFDKRHVYLNDPANGRRKVSHDDFDAMFTGVVLTFKPGEDFVKSDERPSLKAALIARTRGFRPIIAFVFLASLALVLPGIILPVFSRIFVDNVLVAGFGDWVIPVLAGMLITALVRFILVELQNWYLARAETQLAVNGAVEMFVHVLRLPISYFGSRYIGEIASRLELTDGIAVLLTGDVVRIVLNLITASFFLALMLAYSPIITLVVLLTSIANVFFIVGVSRLMSETYRKLSIEGGKLSGVTLAGIRNIETYKAAGAEDSFFNRWAGMQARVISIDQSISTQSITIGSIPGLLNGLSGVAILILGGMEVMRGDMTIGTLVAFQSLSASFMGPVLTLTSLAAKFQEVRSLTERVEDVLQHSIDPLLDERPAELETLPKGSVELKDVSFTYLPLEPPLIEGLDLTVPAGSRVALVGASGSGKSTIGRVIVGLYQPTGGEVLVDKRSLNEWPRAALASRLAYIDQEVVLFEGTVRENLTLWDPTIPDSQVVQAARDALIHDVIANRPGTYDSMIEEGGRNFSGGQRQRLEIARALATNPKVLVMDEATSALDTVAEAELMQNIQARNITLILIAHRLSTIRDCDEIIVLDRGKPVERGTHDQLMAQEGRYAALLEA